MIDHAENTLTAAINSLVRTVGPSIRSDDPQAHEQLRLTIQFLEFLRDRLPDIHRRHAVELLHRIDLARSLLVMAEEVSPEAGHELADATRRATATLADPSAFTTELRDAQAEILRAIRGLVRTARSARPALSTQVRETVLRASTRQLDLESAWYSPYGFVRDDPTRRPLAELLCATDPA